MLTALIIDDEQNNLDNLQAILSEHCPEVFIAGTASNGKEGMALIRNIQPDLIFLDIQMPRMNGFEMLMSLDKYNFEIIFVTAFDQYGIQAVKFAAIDYILKPVNIHELKDAVQKVVLRNALKSQNLRLENLIQIMEKNKPRDDHRIALASVKEVRFVPTDQIIRCVSSNNYTTFYLLSSEQIVASKPIFEYEGLLADYGFIRCHQSHLVNRKYIKSYVKEMGGYLITDDGAEIPVSRQKKEYVKATLAL
ncbi:MAG: LytTR family DNA-binding domain-containing protein [Pedobacter sp.]|nr:LytTR family DNA-binding domain-containing protein [Pedobacter sp.]